MNEIEISTNIRFKSVNFFILRLMALILYKVCHWDEEKLNDFLKSKLDTKLDKYIKVTIR